MKPSFYTEKELAQIGLKSYGKKVLISRYARLYSPENIEIGNNVRIDDFCILSGIIKIGSNIHIGAHVALFGAYGIELEDYSAISPRTIIYSASDDFGGDFLIGPTQEKTFTNVSGGKVTLKKYTAIGSSCVVLPNVTINEGSVVGAMSLVTKSLDEWTINIGIPTKIIKNRSKDLLKFIK